MLMRRVIVALCVLLGMTATVNGHARAQDTLIDIFDAHLHYNWEPEPYYQLDEVLALFNRHRVTGILATSRPNVGTQALVATKGDGLWVVPFIRPYRVRADIASWMGDPKIFDLVQEEFSRGGYRGIGEFHLSGRAAANEWVKRTVDFAVEKKLFLHCHCDAEALEILFSHNSRARIIWAHTGFSLAPERVGALLEKYTELWGELSYRSGITDGTGKLSTSWRALFERHADRFLIGSDTWINERWASYGDIIAQYRSWLAQLPVETAQKIANRNASRLFGS